MTEDSHSPETIPHQRFNGLTIASLIEIIIASGILLAALRIFVGTSGSRISTLPARIFVNQTATGLFTSIGLAGGIGLLFEYFRTRAARNWSIGRWCWSIAGFYYVLTGFWSVLMPYLYASVRPDRWTPSPHKAASYAFDRFMLDNRSVTDLSMALVALCFTAWITQVLPKGPVDLRERLGRIYASLIAAAGIAAGLTDALSR